jgi:hypothetical protein
MVAHVPAGACDCGRPLADATDLGVGRSHQVHDVALVSATVTQHDLHRAQCDCGQIHQALRPEGMSASATSYGLNLQGLPESRGTRYLEGTSAVQRPRRGTSTRDGS